MLRKRSRPPAPRLDPRQDVAALREAVHGRLRGCRWCGAGTRTAPGPDGWATCSECSVGVARWGADWPAAAAGLVVDVDPEDLDPFVFGRLVVPAYRDAPGATPDRPEAERWAHLGTLARHDLLARLQALTAEGRDLARGGPCGRCGAGYSETWAPGPEGRTICAVCATDGTDGARSIDQVAADLVGIVGTPDRFAAEVGFRWWAETPGAEAGHPWGYVDLDALRRRAAEVVPWPSRWRDGALAARLGVRGAAPTYPERIAGGPCPWCGVTASTSWTRGACSRCFPEHHDPRTGRPRSTEDAADEVVSRLLRLPRTVAGIAAAVGWRWHHEVRKAPTDDRRRYVYVDRDDLARRAADAGYLVPVP